MASGILLQFSRAPLNVLGILLDTQRFSWRGWFIAFCRAFLSLPSLPVVLVCYCLGLAQGLGVG